VSKVQELKQSTSGKTDAQYNPRKAIEPHLSRLYHQAAISPGIHHVWKLHGLPKSIISDRGVQFAAGIIRELNNLLGIQMKLSTAYHPQTDGQTERINQELEQYLRVFIDHRQEQWPDWLEMMEFVYNNKIHTVTKILPFKVSYGQDPRMGFEERRKRKYEAVGKFVERIKKI